MVSRRFLAVQAVRSAVPLPPGQAGVGGVGVRDREGSAVLRRFVGLALSPWNLGATVRTTALSCSLLSPFFFSATCWMLMARIISPLNSEKQNFEQRFVVQVWR